MSVTEMPMNILYRGGNIMDQSWNIPKTKVPLKTYLIFVTCTTFLQKRLFYHHHLSGGGRVVMVAPPPPQHHHTLPPPPPLYHHHHHHNQLCCDLNCFVAKSVVSRFTHFWCQILELKMVLVSKKWQIWGMHMLTLYRVFFFTGTPLKSSKYK